MIKGVIATMTFRARKSSMDSFGNLLTILCVP